MLSYLFEICAFNCSSVLLTMRPSIVRSRQLIKFKSETTLQIVENSKSSISKQHGPHKWCQNLVNSGNLRRSSPDLTLFDGKNEAPVMTNAFNRSLKFRKKQEVTPNLQKESSAVTSSPECLFRKSPTSSSSSSSSSGDFDDVYSISRLADLRDTQIKSDGNLDFDSPGSEKIQQPNRQSRFRCQDLDHFNFEPETASHSNVSTFLSDESCSDRSAMFVPRDSYKALDDTFYARARIVECCSKSQGDTSMSDVPCRSNGCVSHSSQPDYRGRVGDRKPLPSSAPVDEPLTVSTDSLCSYGRTKKFPIFRENTQESVSYAEREKSFNFSGSCKVSPEGIHVTSKRLSAAGLREAVTTGGISLPTDIDETSFVLPSDSKTAASVVESTNRFCLSCAEGLVAKWRRILTSLSKKQRPVARRSRISGLVTPNSPPDESKNSTFSFIFTTSLTGSKEPVSFFKQTFPSRNSKSKKDFDGVEEICSTVPTGTALAQMTSTFTGVLLYRQRCWHVTNYLCIGDRYCASNGQLLCQMSVAGLVILCCHDLPGLAVEAGGWTAARSEHQHKNSSTSASLSSPLNHVEHPVIIASGRLASFSGYTHPECDSDHAIPMIPCVCGSNVKSSERHNRSALRLNLTGSSLIEIQSCFPEMNRFIDGFRRKGLRVMIVSAYYPNLNEGSHVTDPNGRADRDSLSYSNPAFESGEDFSDSLTSRKSRVRQLELKSSSDEWQRQLPLQGDTLTVLAVLQHLMLVDRMTFREARNVLLRAHYPLRLSRAVISLLESIEHSMTLQRRRAARD